MFSGLAARIPLRGNGLLLTIVTVITCLVATLANADRSSFRTYDAEQGLASLGGRCMVQDGAGYIYVCTEHGVFVYDGRHFINLGPDQGLRQGGVVKDIALTSTGRVVASYPDEVLVSDRPTDASNPPSTLSFRAVLHPGLTFFDDRGHSLAPSGDGLVLLAGDTIKRIVIPSAGASRVEAMGYDLQEQEVLNAPTGVFSVRGSLWETFEDGRLCAADPGAVKCYAAPLGLHDGPWVHVSPGPAGTILARSAFSVGALTPSSGLWSVTDLPDQGGRYVNYRGALKLFTAPDGSLMTQADHGLVRLGPGGWRMLTVADGAPSGIIVSAMTDSDGQFWFQIFGRGLVRWIGYGHWSSVQKAEGLSDGLAWRTARLPGGSLWVATDTGVDEIVSEGASVRVSKVLPGASFALAVGSGDKLWRGYGVEGARALDAATGAESTVAMPPVNSIVSAADGVVWFGTQSGLFSVDDRSGPPYRAVLEGSPKAAVADMVSDGLGGVLYLTGGRLRHRRPDGDDVPVSGQWPDSGFEPHALAVGHDGAVWVGGAGGLFRLVLSADRVSSYELVPTAQTRTNTITAVMVDHRGWVWAGTAIGLSVFDQHRWVSVDADSGLISNDVDEGGLREDPDGSVWIATSQGLSHLSEPGWLFVESPIRVVVSRALLGARSVTGHTMPYTRDPLTVEFGTPDHGAESSILFRYRLSGVDAGWTESSSGLVRYPAIPPGAHVLTVVGYNELTHGLSPPVELAVDIAYPWWRQWWSETAWILIIIGLVYGAVRLRFRTLLARQAELKRHVAEATEQLRYQAAHDSLTGLLTRREIEARLAGKLSGGGGASAEMILALIDVDNFKRVNDTHGHLGGDDVLRAMGLLVRNAVRDGEYAGRYGGEEILLVLDDSDGRGADRILDLHHAIRGGPFNAAGRAIRITCSIGLTWAIHDDDWQSLIGRADDALYVAKRSGRDQVVESGPTRAGTPGATGEPRFRPSSP